METAKLDNGRKGNKLFAFLNKNYAFFFAPILVAALYIAALWQYDVFPFGDKYTAASYDLSAQICPFIEHLFDVFDGKSTLTFSYAIVGGADVTGTFLYFFISPFSFLFLLFGDGRVAHASSIVMLCKLATISVAGTWFAKKLFRGIPDYLCIAVGVTYAYCGYTFVANTYIGWMDFLIYLPFAVGAFRHFVKTEKFLPFSLLVACCIYTCFSIACFSMFTVFPALVAYGLLCVEKENRMRFIAYLSLSFLVAILIALPVLFPALGAYSVSGRGGSLFENLWRGFALQEGTGALGSFNSSDFVNPYVESLYRKWSYIVSDSIFVALTLVWLWRKGLKDRFAQFMLVAGLLTLLPTLVDESMNLLNMGSYMSYALRFGFLNALYFLGGACLCLEGWCYKPLVAYDGTPLLPSEETVDCAQTEKKGGRYAFKRIFCKKNKEILLPMGILLGVALLLTVFLIWFITGTNYQKLLEKFGSNARGFSGSFAHSLGGLDVVVFPFIVVVILAFVGCALIYKKKVSPRFVSLLLLVVVGTQVLFYNNHLVLGNRSTQHQALASYQTLSEEFNRREEGYFRVKDYDDKLTACAPFTGNANSFSVFSSVIDKDNFTVFQLFGYKGNGKNSFKSAHNTGKYNRNDAFGDSFMGYRYVVSEDEDLHESDLGKTYLKPVYVEDEKGNLIHLSNGDFYAYENESVFPLGYRVQEGGFSFVAENISNSANRKQNQLALYQYLRGKECASAAIGGEATAELNSYLQAKAADVEVSAGKITAKVTAEAGEDLLLNFVAVKGYSVTVNGKKASLIENDLNFLLVHLEEGENEVVFTYSSPYVKYMAIGLACSVLSLLAVAFVVKRTKLVEKAAVVIAWAAIALSVGLVAFFMLYPTGVFLAKLFALLKSVF